MGADGGGAREPTVTVLVPSYRRPQSLQRCLEGVLAGTRRPEQIVAVLRDSDVESHAALAAWRNAHPGLVAIAQVTEPGPMAAANAGLQLARGEVVAFLDDDCVPSERWLERILAHYADPEVIGVGGRDIVHHGDRISADPKPVVGRVTWYGRIIGNHHQPGFTEPVYVDHLKGANMSFRRAVIPTYDLRLRSGVYHEVDVAFGARAGGGRIVYDPAATVDHYPAPRWYGHERESEALQAVTDLAHDHAYVMFKHLRGWRRAGFWMFALLVGQHHRYGLLRMLVMLPRERLLAVRRWQAALRGTLAARRTRRAALAEAAARSSQHRGDSAP